MIPCLELAGGNCHDVVIMLELIAVTLKLPGACDGTFEI